MCGRYVFYLLPAKLKEYFGLENLLNLPPRYNCAPMQSLPIIVKNRVGMARWGFCPPWKAEDDSAFAAKMINARSETVHEKPAFKESWQRARRCLVPANGFYEWKKDQNTGVNQPYYIYPAEGSIIAFAGLWSKVGDLVTFTILTKDAEGDIADIHHRTPVILSPSQAAEWFTASPEEAAAMIRQATSKDLAYYSVHTDVGKVSNDDERLIEKVAV